MYGTAKGLVGRRVAVTILRKPKHTFERTVTIVGVEAGVMRVKGCSGMVTEIPLDDEYMRVESIRALT